MRLCLLPNLCHSPSTQEKHRNSSDGLMPASRFVCAKHAQDTFDRPDFPVLLMMHLRFFLFEVYHRCPFPNNGSSLFLMQGNRILFLDREERLLQNRPSFASLLYRMYHQGVMVKDKAAHLACTMFFSPSCTVRRHGQPISQDHHKRARHSTCPNFLLTR